MFQKELKLHLERKQYIGILRNIGDEEEEMVFGVPVALSKGFLVIQEVSEFFLYGYTIIPLDSIVEVRRDASDTFIEGILRQEGFMERISMKYPLDLKDWKSIFTGLHETQLAVTVQCEELGEDFFFIGQVKRVDNDAIWIHHIDSEGVLAESWDEVLFEDITKAGFDEPYANMFFKHVRNLN